MQQRAEDGESLFLVRVNQTLTGIKLLAAAAPRKATKFFFGGTPEDSICQIGVKEPYTETKKDIEMGEYDIHGNNELSVPMLCRNYLKIFLLIVPLKMSVGVLMIIQK